MIKQLLVILIMGMSSAIPLNTYSCALHGDGNDGFGFGRFTQFHPLAQQHNTEQYSQTLVLKHTTKTQVLSGEETAVTIAYRVPINYEKVNVSFSGSQYIEFLESPIMTLPELAGTYKLRYQVSRPGLYQISIQVVAFDGIKPFSLLQHIEVQSN
jgi:hypothetical protein